MWRDRWVTSGGSPLVYSDSSAEWPELRVRDILNDTRNTWDPEALVSFFSADDAARIAGMRLRPNNVNHNDRLLWTYSNDALYSLKSGYFTALEEVDVDNGVELTALRRRCAWAWSLKVTPKLQVFVWRCMWDILPTCMNLVCRLTDVDPICVRYGEETKTTEHALRDCVWVRSFWQESGLMGVAEMNSGLPKGEWIFTTASALDQPESVLFLYMVWQLWYARNKLYFESVVLLPLFLLAAARAFQDEYNRAQGRGVGQFTGLRGAVRWVRPALVVIKVNNDASVRMGTGVAVGCVARDCRGM
ncbi:hypothetical protein ACS0TY_014551 [Phlomoides rotata]